MTPRRSWVQLLSIFYQETVDSNKLYPELLLCRLNKPRTFSFSSQCHVLSLPSPVQLGDLCWTIVFQYPSYSGEPRTRLRLQMCYILSIQTSIQLAFFSARAHCCPAQVIVLCDLQVCFCKANSTKIGPQPEPVLKFIPPLVQDFSFAFLDLHRGTISPFLWVVEVSPTE